MTGCLSELGTKWETLFLSGTSLSLPIFVWRVSLNTGGWPCLKSDLAQSSLQGCITQHTHPLWLPAHMIIRCYIITNQPFTCSIDVKTN